ncbi:toxin-activating lysine-acyltransferase [Nitratireductor sp. ZSWI3]|uniref:toxin-activating lysine-acyltransferase n=1 Tax=Nitratireductor sp. ZSWI3 TaxID=2966359 RepID=UPI00214FD510|nr:toxin-activating lysine-acyltransferase [Nitratireductor sp. ZSWI3]MCR4267396.1 toxin-activating lysine-acyltransferase [Nitratireductor sp. ZSWI3]
MSRTDLYLGVGFAFELLARSAYHRTFPTGRYLTVEILPALRCGQARFYVNDDGFPTGLVTWARLSEEVEAEILATGRALQPQEWTCGERLFFNDFIAPYGTMAAMIRDLKRNVFPQETASSIRRLPEGRVRRINRWNSMARRGTGG